MVRGRLVSCQLQLSVEVSATRRHLPFSAQPYHLIHRVHARFDDTKEGIHHQSRDGLLNAHSSPRPQAVGVLNDQEVLILFFFANWAHGFDRWRPLTPIDFRASATPTGSSLPRSAQLCAGWHRNCAPRRRGCVCLGLCLVPSSYMRYLLYCPAPPKNEVFTSSSLFPVSFACCRNRLGTPCICLTTFSGSVLCVCCHASAHSSSSFPQLCSKSTSILQLNCPTLPALSIGPHRSLRPSLPISPHRPI